MKRTIKNILMILIILILIFLTYFTLGYLKGEKTLKSVVTEFNASIVFTNEENDTSTETIDENGNITTTVYEEGTTTEENGEVINPDDSVSNEDDILYTTPNGDNDISTTTDGVEETLDKEDLLFENDNISHVYYVAFVSESLLISFTLAYLAYSKFNKFTLKETFNNKKRIIWYVLYSLALSAMCFLIISYLI